MRNRQDREERNQRIIKAARDNPRISNSLLGERFGMDATGIVYVLKTFAPDLYAQRKGVKYGSW